MRDTSPASTSAGATALSPIQTDTSFEDKMMLMQFFDRLEHVPKSSHSIVQTESQTDTSG